MLIVLFRIVCGTALCLASYAHTAEPEIEWRHVDGTTYEIINCCKRDHNVKLKVIAENNSQCLISFVAQFNHVSDTDFHVQAVLLDSDGFEIMRKPLADCEKNIVSPVEKGPQTKIEPVRSYYNIKGTFSIPYGFFERTKDVELRFYRN
jgi:hypothetical protein